MNVTIVLDADSADNVTDLACQAIDNDEGECDPQPMRGNDIDDIEELGEATNE